MATVAESVFEQRTYLQAKHQDTENLVITHEAEMLEEEPCFPGPLLRKDLKTENLIRFLQWKVKECLHVLRLHDQTETYFFWQIMELFCSRNRKVMMCEVALVLFRGYSVIRKLQHKTAEKCKDWCIPLAKLLCSSVPNDEVREAVIKLGDDLASRQLTYAAHICYVVAQVELGSRGQFELIGYDRVPIGVDVLTEAIMRTETYEYVLSLTSGLAQPNFQIFKLSYVTRMVYTELAQCDLSDDAIKYCETMARAAMAFPDRLKGSFIKRLLMLSCVLFEEAEVEPEWLLELRQLQRTNDDGNQEQHTASTSQDTGSESQDSVTTDEMSDLCYPDLDPDADPEDVFHSRYTLGKELGSGGNSTIYDGVRKKDGKRVAIKFAVKEDFDDKIMIPGEVQELPIEVGLMKLVSKVPRCNNVMVLLDWFELRKKYVLVLEFPSPCLDVWDFVIQQNCCVSESQIRNIMLQVVQAARHCCEHGVFHSDIKAENLLINTETLQVKLIDFGAGEILTDTPYSVFNGTNGYVPPEYLLFKNYMGIPATIWSLGILLYYMIHQAYPFESLNDLYSGNLEFSPSMSRECFDFVLWCLDINPDMRPTFDDLLRHEWFTKELQDEVNVRQ